MAKQTFTTGQVLTAAQMTSLQDTAMGGGSATAKTASYTLVAADAGTTVIMNSASATTITVNTSLFSAGDTVFIQNIGAGISTITAGTATVNTASSLALAQYESGNLYFTAAGASIFSKADGASVSGGMTLLSTTNLLGATVSISSISTSYKKLFVLVRNPSLSSAGSIFFKFNTSTVPLLSGVNNGTAYAAENGTFLPSNSTNPLILQFEIGNYANGSYAKSIIGSSCGVEQTDGAVWGGYINTNTAITNITFTATSPREYEAGDVLIYGVN
jgi:hypothetical protein